MNDITVKNADKNIIKELNSIGFDNSYKDTAQKKYTGQAYKIFNLKPYEANILKQICLSLGCDCALNRDSVTCKCDKTDCLIFATKLQYEKLIQKLKQQPFRLKTLSQKLSDIINYNPPSLQIGNYTFDWKRPYIMGILNVTPDSFSDGGQFNSTEKAIEHCFKLIEDGADIIDIGGESTRPEAQCITVEEEMKRVIPVIEQIRKNNIKLPVSIDTRNYKTAKSAIEAGADIINDVSGLDYDKKLFEYTAQNNIPVIIMHSDKVPAISKNYTNADIVEEVYKSLSQKIEMLINAGMNKKNIITDVGIGFGKSTEGNIQLLKRINEFTSLKTPLLLGISRKSFMRNSFNISYSEADILTAFYSAMLKNINIHRVHNVQLTKQFLEYAKLLN